jgi:hypothetical protein
MQMPIISSFSTPSIKSVASPVAVVRFICACGDRGEIPPQSYLGSDIRPSIILQAVENHLQLPLTYNQKVLYYFKVQPYGVI